MKVHYIDETQKVDIYKYPEEVQGYLKRLEELDGVESEEYFDKSDALEKILRPYAEAGKITERQLKEAVIRYSYTLDQIEHIKGIRLF